MQRKGLTAAKLAVDSGVNKSYMSYILNGQLTYQSTDDTMVEIPDKYYVQVARFIKFPLEKTYWPHVDTREYVEIMHALKEAKEEHTMKMLFIDSGAGKTYAFEDFKKQNPLYTYTITMHTDLTVNDMFNELVRQMDIPNKGSKGWKRAQTIIKLREIRKDGGNPVVLIDEGENMNTRMRQTIKGFYDGILGYASIAVLGTPDLEGMMKDAKAKGVDGGPQTYRRFRAGMQKIKLEQNKAKRFEPFFTALQDMGMPIEDGLQELLVEICDNYGELHNFLEPALRKADKKNTRCTEDFFRLMYNLPKMTFKRA
jgi:transcriptional regulator with XRE-family HTH domain